MLSVNCPICGQKVTEVKSECEMTTKCPKCKCTFDTHIENLYVAYKILKDANNQSVTSRLK